MDFKWLMIMLMVVGGLSFAPLIIEQFQKGEIAKASAFCLSYEDNDWNAAKSICVKKSP